MIDWFKKVKVAPMCAEPGDHMRLTYTDKFGKRTEQLTETITEPGVFDTLAVGKVSDELGFESGLVMVIGTETPASA